MNLIVFWLYLIIIVYKWKNIGMSAINVYYDQQEGSYFKIDK